MKKVGSIIFSLILAGSITSPVFGTDKLANNVILPPTSKKPEIQNSATVLQQVEASRQAKASQRKADKQQKLVPQKIRVYATGKRPGAYEPKKLTKDQFLTEFIDARMISFAVGACAGTYVPEGNAAEYNYMREYGWSIHPYKTVNDGVETNFMIAVNPRLIKGKRYGVLAFRGSSSVGDWKQDFDFKLVPYGGNTVEEFKKIALSQPQNSSKLPKVHRGFHEFTLGAFNLHADIDGDAKQDDIIAKLKSDHNFVLLITGHSLGGAAATLFGERLVSMGVNKEQVPVVTFGAPAVGNNVFAKEYGDKINLIRVRTKHDVVPKVLALTGKYKQFGKEYIFDLSRKASDMSHPLGNYFDFAFKHYYDVTADGIANGYMYPPAKKQLVGAGPVVAVMVDGIFEKDEPPIIVSDLKLLAADEYRAVLPRYVFLAEEKFPEDYTVPEVLQAAKDNAADYLIIIKIGRRNIAQNGNYFTNMEQLIFRTKNGSLLSMNNAGSRITYDAGYVQTAIKDMEKCMTEIKEKLPFVYKVRKDVQDGVKD